MLRRLQQKKEGGGQSLFQSLIWFNDHLAIQDIICNLDAICGIENGNLQYWNKKATMSILHQLIFSHELKMADNCNIYILHNEMQISIALSLWCKLILVVVNVEWSKRVTIMTTVLEDDTIYAQNSQPRSHVCISNVVIAILQSQHNPSQSTVSKEEPYSIGTRTYIWHDKS